MAVLVWQGPRRYWVEVLREGSLSRPHWLCIVPRVFYLVFDAYLRQQWAFLSRRLKMNMPKQAKPIFRREDQSARFQFVGDVVPSADPTAAHYMCKEKTREIGRFGTPWTPVDDGPPIPYGCEAYVDS